MQIILIYDFATTGSTEEGGWFTWKELKLILLWRWSQISKQVNMWIRSCWQDAVGSNPAIGTQKLTKTHYATGGGGAAVDWERIWSLKLFSVRIWAAWTTACPPCSKEKKWINKPSAYLHLPESLQHLSEADCGRFPTQESKPPTKAHLLRRPHRFIGPLFDNREARHSCQLRKQKGKGVSH